MAGSAEGARRGEAREGSMQEVIPGGRERILIVDDEPFLAYLWGKMLERLGYQFVACSGGQEALEMFRGSPGSFDVVLTDLIMPNLGGDLLVGELLRIRPGIPIILCTGYSNTMTEEKANALGVRAYLMKPLGRRDLALAVRRVLDQQMPPTT